MCRRHDLERERETREEKREIDVWLLSGDEQRLHAANEKRVRWCRDAFVRRSEEQEAACEERAATMAATAAFGETNRHVGAEFMRNRQRKAQGFTSIKI